MLGDSDAKNVLQKSGSVTSRIHLNKKLIMIINDDVKSGGLHTDTLRCLVSYIKNCDPLVFLPRFAIDKRNGFSCLISNDSSRSGNYRKNLEYCNENIFGWKKEANIPSNVPP